MGDGGDAKSRREKMNSDEIGEQHKKIERVEEDVTKKKRVEEDEDDDEGEFKVEDVSDEGLSASCRSRFNLLNNQLGLQPTRRKFSRESLIGGLRDLSTGLAIHPDNRWYRAWKKFILLWAVYSSFFTPMEFGFFRGLPKDLLFLDIAGQIAFFIDIFLQFFVAYRDSQTYRIVYKRTPIALRYLKSSFIADFLGCMPWDIIYKVCGRKEGVRYLLWIRLTRVRRLIDFFQHMEKDIRINYLFTRIVKLIAVELYCTHTAACFFYYLATTLPPEEEGYTWIGSLKLGDYSYSHFREIDIWKRYTTSLYFAIVTMATVGYGDIHAVNLREMIFIMVYVSFDMILGAYLIGNMTALIVKGSKTERFRDKMTDIMKFMNRHRLGKDIRTQIKRHMRLQYESSYTEASVLKELPISIRAKISERLYQPYIENIPLFKGCSPEFINQIVTRVHEEFFLPGEVIMEQGNVVDQLYFVCHGLLEEIGIGEDASEETVSLLEPNSSFGEISILCNIPQPYNVRVCELCRLLRVDKQSFSNVLDIYFYDGRKILNNLLEAKQSNLRLKQLESDITFHVGKQEAEHALRVNSAAYHGDLYQLKGLIRAGADPNKTDYDGRSPLHLSASRGHEDITLFLIQEGVDVNLLDNFGNAPLLEAIKNGHDRVASILGKEGASLQISEPGSFLCNTVSKGDAELLKRILTYGINPNSKDYDHRTPLHVAASGGFYFMAKLLVEAGASIFSKDRYSGDPLMAILNEAHEIDRLLQKDVNAQTRRTVLVGWQPPPPNLVKLNTDGSVLESTAAAGGLLRDSRGVWISGFTLRIGLGTPESAELWGLLEGLNLAWESGFRNVAAEIDSKTVLDLVTSPPQRWGKTPLDEGRLSGNRNMVKLFEDAQSAQASRPDESHDAQESVHRRKCTVFPFHPWDPIPKENRRHGIVVWISRTMEELIGTAAEQLKASDGSCLLTEDGGKISDVSMIDDGQKLYLVSETH